MSEEVSYEARLVESFVPPPLRLAASDAATSTDGDMALLWLDVVGFTGITGRLVETGPAGIEQMAAVLDRHFDALIGSIVAHGGEPLMFAGDGLLSGWRRSAGTPREAVLRAAACGQAILCGLPRTRRYSTRSMLQTAQRSRLKSIKAPILTYG